MYATGNKKMLNMLILEILWKYTDEEHALTQQDILKLLKNYGMECDRRSVKNNVLYLKELGYDISMEKGYRLLSRDFDDSELRILIDSVLFSKSISTKQARDLINKIREKLASNYFNAKVSHVSNLPELNRTINKQAMYSLDALNDAIADKKKVSFIYNNIGTDFKLHPRREEPYIVNPYQIVANNGRFYLIGNYDKYDNVAHFRIDRMTDVRILDEKIKPMSMVPEMKNGLNLPKHMAEHFYMFSGESVAVTIRTTEDMMSELVDWFGKNFSVIEKKDGNITVRVTCNKKAMRFWALQYGPYVEILKPESLRDQIKEDINSMSEKYMN
ncbi:Predicted DNA-binding transcriptional regulator YafY, contains an HTH and WYL domains [Lachnospiraceae bacterium]|nr:Predicted DNA-binding transcriptional regulator YafY, contains an HTH and WYL domains [Lachnospiraceae bacterium]